MCDFSQAVKNFPSATVPSYHAACWSSVSSVVSQEKKKTKRRQKENGRRETQIIETIILNEKKRSNLYETNSVGQNGICKN